MIVNSGLLVLREGLEAILVLAAVTASFVGADKAKRRPVAIGAGLSFLATVATWFAAVWAIGALAGPALDVQAATGLLAVAVLLVVMNWFFHRMYWTGWIAHHHGRRRILLARSPGGALTAGLIALGFTIVYREGFEIVLFLQTLRLKYGAGVVLEGVALGLTFTAAVGILTFVAHHKLPYRRMLVLTGAMIGFVPNRDGRRERPGAAARRLAPRDPARHYVPGLDRHLVRSIPDRRDDYGTGIRRHCGHRLLPGCRACARATAEARRARCGGSSRSPTRTEARGNALGSLGQPGTVPRTMRGRRSCSPGDLMAGKVVTCVRSVSES